MNKLNIDDVIKVVHPGMGDDGKEGPVTGMQKWPDGTIVYDVQIHYDCPDGGQGWDGGTQVKDGEYEIVDHEDNKGDSNKAAVILELKGVDEFISGLNGIEAQLDRILKKKKQL